MQQLSQSQSDACTEVRLCVAAELWEITSPHPNLNGTFRDNGPTLWPCCLRLLGDKSGPLLHDLVKTRSLCPCPSSMPTQSSIAQVLSTAFRESILPRMPKLREVFDILMTSLFVAQCSSRRAHKCWLHMGGYPLPEAKSGVIDAVLGVSKPFLLFVAAIVAVIVIILAVAVAVGVIPAIWSFPGTSILILQSFMGQWKTYKVTTTVITRVASLPVICRSLPGQPRFRAESFHHSCTRVDPGNTFGSI